MAYQIKCDAYPLHDMRDDELIVFNPKVKLEVNTVGSGSFLIYSDHPYYDKLLKLKSIFEVSDDMGVIFRGRMTNDSKDFDNGKAVDLEGAMAFFNDSVVRPFSFPEDFLEDAGYVAAAATGNVIEFFLKWLIDTHNSQVQPFQRMKLGVVTVTDPNNYLSRSSETHASTWETLKSKLFDSALGGKLCIRYEADGNFIDYLDKFTLDNPQEIVYGENLLDLKNDSDASETYSAIIPIGAEIEVETEAEDGSTITIKKKVNIENLEDGAVTDDIMKQGDTLYSKSAVEAYGWIYAPVSETTWDDVTDANNLCRKGTEWLSGTGIKLANTIEITAVDLHFTDEEIQSFRIYRNIRARSAVHGLAESYELTVLDLDLMNVQNTKIKCGATTLTLIDQNNKDKADTSQRIETAEKDISENKNGITETKEQMIAQSTSLINTCESIILSALESYVETSNYESFKETVETQMEVLAGEISMKFTEATELIENVNGDLQEKYNTITKYFTFSVDGLIIGQIDNPYKMVLDNDRYSMLVNDVEVLWIDAITKEVHTPVLTVTDRFRLLGYLIEQDSLGNVNCEYIGGEE